MPKYIVKVAAVTTECGTYEVDADDDSTAIDKAYERAEDEYPDADLEVFSCDEEDEE